MQFQKVLPLGAGVYRKPWFIVSLLLNIFFISSISAQVNSVEFGKNRVQYKKFKWAYYQTENFNSYYSQNGEPLAKYVAQIAEKELPDMESFTEYGLQRRANIIVYNSYDEMQQSNIGLGSDWQTAGGSTRLVNNKMIVYFNGDHADLRRQIREGIAKVLLDNILFGDDLGEFAANQALLDLPKWLTDGYIEYAGENWSTALDDELKSAVLSGSYKNFYQFAFVKPTLAGHAFWNYIAETYKKENVTYFLYLARVYRNLNGASQRIAKKKFKEVLKDFMAYQEDKYYKDIRSRRNTPKGSNTVVEEVKHNKDFFRFTPNPAPRSQTYAVVEFKAGVERVVLYDNFVDRKVLLKSGVRTNDNVPNPNYPMMAWDPKGTRLAVVYWKEGKVKLFVYDDLKRYKPVKVDLPDFDQVQDVKFMLDNNTLLFSAVKKGQSDIFVYKIDKESTEQITNDVFDDLDATFISFPNKTGIIYSSNRPSATAVTADTALPSDHRYNIFLVDNWNRSEFKQISQLTFLKFGNARYPVPYNTTHFTFVSDENGIGNRYAGFFKSTRAGVDTVYKIGNDLVRNPDPRDLDSLLKASNKSQPDSVFAFSVTNDSAYVFAITNYQSSLTETKVAGSNGLVSEVRKEGNLKFLYKLKVDENALRRRNVIARPTDYRRRTIEASRIANGDALQLTPRAGADSAKKKDVFESEFGAEKTDTTATRGRIFSGESVAKVSVLDRAKRFDYTLKFSVDQVTGSLFNNDVLVTKYQPYTGSLPVTLNNGAFNGLAQVTLFDVLEDFRFTGMFRSPLLNAAGSGVPVTVGTPNIFVPGTQSLFNSGSEYLTRFDYLKHRIDFSGLYYRKTDVGSDGSSGYPVKLYTNLFQGIMKYPLDKVRSIRISVGVRTDKYVLKGIDEPSLKARDSKQTFGLTRLEYVYDNTVIKATNIMNGLRYKFYIDYNTQLNSLTTQAGRNSFNFGFDARNYVPIYRNFIWAVRGSGDFSWGQQKIIYYLGGVDGGLFPKYSQNPRPQDPDYAFQSLAVNMRGFPQNVANGNNAVVINSEFRLPVFSTLFNKPINNAFLRNFEVIQFFDLGSAWNGNYNKIERPYVVYGESPVSVLIKAGGIGPFVGSYGFGVRSTLLGYFLRFDTGWEMNGIFRGKPMVHFAMGLDF